MIVDIAAVFNIRLTIDQRLWKERRESIIGRVSPAAIPNCIGSDDRWIVE
jgi:hypothetical protein